MSGIPIALFLLDDHPVVTAGLRVLFEREPDVEVVGEATSLADVVATQPRIDVIVADLMLGEPATEEVVSTLVARFPDSRVLVLTMVDDPAEVRRALAHGASGYVLKGAAADVLVDAVRAVAGGELYVQPSLGAVLARPDESSEACDAVASLTDREQEVLRLIALGHTNNEIAATLAVAVRTAEAHRSHILEKLGVRTRAELVRIAVASELVDFGRR